MGFRVGGSGCVRWCVMRSVWRCVFVSVVIFFVAVPLGRTSWPYLLAVPLGRTSDQPQVQTPDHCRPVRTHTCLNPLQTTGGGFSHWIFRVVGFEVKMIWKYVSEKKKVCGKWVIFSRFSGDFQFIIVNSCLLIRLRSGYRPGRSKSVPWRRSKSVPWKWVKISVGRRSKYVPWKWVQRDCIGCCIVY